MIPLHKSALLQFRGQLQQINGTVVQALRLAKAAGISVADGLLDAVQTAADCAQATVLALCGEDFLVRLARDASVVNGMSRAESAALAAASAIAAAVGSPAPALTPASYETVEQLNANLIQRLASYESMHVSALCEGCCLCGCPLPLFACAA